VGFCLLSSVRMATAGSVAASVAASSAAEAVMMAESRKGKESDEVKPMTAIGVVSSKTTLVTTQGAKAKLGIRDLTGQETIYTISGDTVFIGQDGDVTSLDWIGKTDKVSVAYVLGNDGLRVAKTIKKISDFSVEK
jgi:hypothetical protein